MSRSTDNPRFIRYLPGAAVLAFCIAALSQANKQVFARDALLSLGEKRGRLTHEVIDRAKRGPILSADDRPLAQNQDTALFSMRFDQVPHSPAFFMALSEATGVPAAEFESLASNPRVVNREWRRPLSSEQARRAESVKREWRADGLSVFKSRSRDYPLGWMASTIVGQYEDGTISFGLERALNGDLRGKDGKTIGMIDREGSFLPMRLDRDSIKRQDGKSITLTLDSELQSEAAMAVRTAVESNEAESGVAIVMDPRTGDVLAMANWPSQDPSVRTLVKDGDKVSTGLNPNYMLKWEPGSTFKILTLAKALDDGVVTTDSKFTCKGALNVWPGIDVHCDNHGRGTRAHGVIDPTMAIAKSCNVNAAWWAKQIGYEPMVSYLEAVGLLERTGIGLPGEISGSINRKEYAKGLQLATIGFGQSITVTPLGLIDAFCTLANKGIRMKPRIVKSVGGVETQLVSYPRAIRAETCQEVMRCMEAVIQSDSGTGKRLRIPGYDLGGKTGTAQKIDGKTGSRVKGYVSNFVGFVPAMEPRAVILVMIDQPKRAIYGSEVAGPVFMSIAKAVVRRLEIPQSETKVPGSSPGLPGAKGKGPNVRIDAKPKSAPTNKDAEPRADSKPRTASNQHGVERITNAALSASIDFRKSPAGGR